MKIASFSYSLSHWASRREDWENEFLNELDMVIQKGADVILYSELFLMGLAQYFSGDFDFQLNAISSYTEQILKPKIQNVIAGRPVFLCLGSGPRVSGKAITNTCWIWNNGAWFFQDKLHLTPWEASFTPGNTLSLFTFKELRIAVLICFDVEQPSLCSKLKSAGIHLLLVPSATVDRNGSQRVNRCASARSIELGAAVVTAPLVGKSTCDLVDENEGRQGFFLPAQAAVKVDQELFSTYSSDEKIISFFDVAEETLFSLKVLNKETKPFLIVENNEIAINSH